MIFIHLEHKIELSFIKNPLFRCEVKLQYSQFTLWTRIVIGSKSQLFLFPNKTLWSWYWKITISWPWKFLEVWKINKSGCWKFRHCYFDIRNLASSKKFIKIHIFVILKVPNEKFTILQKSQMVKRSVWDLTYT